MNNQRQLAICIMAYAQDNDAVLPLPADWVTATNLRSDPKVFDCPTNTHKGSPDDPGYGMNAYLYDSNPKNGKKIGVPWGIIKDPSSVELTTDISGPTGQGMASNPFPGTYTFNGFDGIGANADWRHNKGIIVSYVDGHVKWVRPEELSAAGRTRYNIPVGKKPAGSSKQ